MIAVTTMSRVRHARRGRRRRPRLDAIVVIETLTSIKHERRPRCRGRRARCGPASYTGTNRIRFRGSVVCTTLSARRALPGGGSSVVLPSLHRRARYDAGDERPVDRGRRPRLRAPLPLLRPGHHRRARRRGGARSWTRDPRSRRRARSSTTSGSSARPRVGIVVNTHGHCDHSFGNSVFRPAVIWGHERCVTMIRTTGEAQRASAAEEIPDIAGDLAEVVLDPPDRTFTDRADPRPRRARGRARLPRARPHRQRHRGHDPRRRRPVRRRPARERRAAVVRRRVSRWTGRRRPRRCSALVGERTVVVPGTARMPTGRSSSARRRDPARSPDLALRVQRGEASLEDGRRRGALPARPPRREPLERALAQLRGELGAPEPPRRASPRRAPPSGPAPRRRRSRRAPARASSRPTSVIPSSIPRGRRSVASRPHRARRALDRHVGRVHPQQRHAAEDEREDRRRELRAAGVARRGDRGADPQRPQHVGQRRASRRCPRPPPSARSRAAVRAPSPRPGSGTPSRRGHGGGRARRACRSPPRPRDRVGRGSRRRSIPTPPDAPVTSTGPSPGRRPAILERRDAHRRREAGRPDRHRVAGGQAVGHRHDPARRGSARTSANPPWRAVPMS